VSTEFHGKLAGFATKCYTIGGLYFGRRADIMVNPDTVPHMETFFKNNDIHFHEMVEDVET
jgi:hypothetical protein